VDSLSFHLVQMLPVRSRLPVLLENIRDLVNKTKASDEALVNLVEEGLRRE
jgi:hypothetical protein